MQPVFCVSHDCMNIDSFTCNSSFDQIRPFRYPVYQIGIMLYIFSRNRNVWMNKMNTASIMGQNVLHLFANYLLLSPIKGHTKHIAGKDTHQADDISRGKELFTPQKTHLSFLFSIDTIDL